MMRCNSCKVQISTNMNFIKPNVSPQKRRRVKSAIEGMGLNMLALNNKPKEYIYWDNVNELVDRLRLLVASTSAGNNNHNNEIISIIEELHEAQIIY